MNWTRTSVEYKRKQRRPFSPKKSLHVVLRSNYAVLRSKRNKKIVSDLLPLYSERFKIRVYQNSLNSNHIHLLILADEKSQLQNFLRVFAGQVAQRITRAVKGRKLSLSFWQKIAWSRVVEWGKSFRTVTAYIFQNQMEALGIVRYQERGRSKNRRL
jgi:REP element-mobilizing transposase RayT